MVKMGEKNSLSTPQKKDYKDKNAVEDIKSNVSNEKSKEKTFGNFSYIHSLTQDIIPVYQMFKQKDFEGLKERLQDMDYYFVGQTFNSYFEFQEYLIRHDGIKMKEVLELSDGDRAFKNILNDFDDEEKAQTFRHDVNNIELYRVLSGETKIIGNIVNVVSILINESVQETQRLLAYLFNVNIVEPEEVSKIREGASFMVQRLRSDELVYKMPNFYKVIGGFKEVLAYLIETISYQNFYYDVDNKEYLILSVMSIRGFSKRYEKEYSGYNPSSRTMQRYINTAVLVNALHKLESELIPESIKGTLLKSKATKEYRYHTNALVLPLFNEEYLVLLEERAKVLNDLKFNRTSLNKDYLLVDFGPDETEKTYSQLKEHEKKLSIKAVKVLEQAPKIINKQLNKHGFITEDKLVKSLYRNNKKINPKLQMDDVKRELNKVRNLICRENNFSVVSLTKKYRLELGISDKIIPANKRPKVYVLNN